MAKEKDDRKLFAFLAVFLTVIGFIIALAVKKDDKYVMFYARQGLVLFFAWIVLQIAGYVLWAIPLFGPVIMAVAYMGTLILWIFGMINSLSGEMRELYIISPLGNKIKI
jgi:uncharacterized membrane protein